MAVTFDKHVARHIGIAGPTGNPSSLPLTSAGAVSVVTHGPVFAVRRDLGRVLGPTFTLACHDAKQVTDVGARLLEISTRFDRDKRDGYFTPSGLADLGFQVGDASHEKLERRYATRLYPYQGRAVIRIEGRQINLTYEERT